MVFRKSARSKLLLVLGLSTCCFLLLFSCSSPAEKTESTTSERTYSPLAKLMRVMEAHGDECKRAIEAGEELPPYPTAIESLLSAEPTKDMHIDSETFPAFATNYQTQVKNLYAAKPEERLTAHNMLIQSCSNCHQAHCPGPLMKIGKMYVEE